MKLKLTTKCRLITTKCRLITTKYNQRMVVSKVKNPNLGLAKIVGYPRYCTNPNMPINILRQQKFFKCRTFSDFSLWNKQSVLNWTKEHKLMAGRQLLNNNVIIADFSFSYDIILNDSNFPDLRTVQDIFFVENNVGFVEKIIEKLKCKMFHVNPVIHIINNGVCFSPLPDYSIRARLNEIQIPLYVQRLNKKYYVPTQSIIDDINDHWLEDLMIKE